MKNKYNTLVLLLFMLFSLNTVNANTIEDTMTSNASKLIQLLTQDFPDFFLEGIYDTDLNNSSYLPIDLNIRKNALVLENLDNSQTKLVHKILSEVLSVEGYSKLKLNLLIDKHYQDKKTRKNSEHIIKLYGDPQQGKWGFKLEGYHLSLNFFIESNHLAFITVFIGQDLDLFEQTEYNVSSLYEYSHKGFEFMKSLSPKQMNKAFIGIATPPDIMSNPNQNAKHLKQRSLDTKKLKKKQKKILSEWINAYIELINPQLIRPLLDDLDTNELDDLNIAWSGGFSQNSDKYYFIFNDNIFIEYNLNSPHLHNILRIQND